MNEILMICAPAPPNQPYTDSKSESSAPKSYEDLNQYRLIETLFNYYPLSHVFKAEHLETKEVWFIALRHGEYSAQVDIAISDIYRKYVPTTPVTKIILDKNNFYIASKELSNLVKITDLPVEHSDFQPVHFGSISVLAHFTGEADIHDDNLLISDSGNGVYIGNKIDNAESLDVKTLKAKRPNIVDDSENIQSAEIELTFNYRDLLEQYCDLLEDGETNCHPFELDDILANHWDLPESILTHQNYLKEQMATLYEISQTPFNEIANMLKITITASKKEEAIDYVKKLQDKGELEPEEANSILEMLKTSTRSSHSDINQILALLQKRHEQYQEFAKLAPPNK